MAKRVFGKLKELSFRRFAVIIFVVLMAVAVTLPAISSSNQIRGPIGTRRLPGQTRTSGRATRAANASGQTQISESALQQITALQAEKQSRTPQQRRISSQLLQAVRESRNESMAAGVNLRQVNVNADNTGRLNVDISGNINDSLVFRIQQLGGQIINSSSEYDRMLVRINLTDVDTISTYPEVKFIRPEMRPMTRTELDNARARALKDTYQSNWSVNSSARHSQVTTFEQRAERVRNQIKGYLANSGTVPDSTGSPITQGDRTHRADDTRSAFGYSGAGIRIGVLSDSYNRLGGAAADVANGNLPGPGNPFGHVTPVTVVQDDLSEGEDEGRAMLQIVHDIAPKAQLFFATAFIDEFSFASNIVSLRTSSNCDIIIDDVGYGDEPPYQDGLIAHAVNTVTAAGALYFSSAGNDGSLVKGTSGVWEGDFSDAGSTPVDVGFPGTAHNFGTVAAPIMGDTILAEGFFYVLNWSDPQGSSGNDYDLFIMDPSLTDVLASSSDFQDGTGSPIEFISPNGFFGDKIVVFRNDGAAVRAFNLTTFGGLLSKGTTGSTFGHNCAQDAFGVAATPAGQPFDPITQPGPFPNAFSSINQIEDFSSDGPRRVFFNTNGTAVTPGNFLFGTNGGTVRNKPDIAAADGVSTTLAANSGLNPFYGTSAAAPHAGAIAALLKSAKPSLTNAQIRTILTSTALDVESPGYDSVSGFGILQAFQAMQAVAPTPLADVELTSATATEGQFKNGNGSIDPGEIANLSIVLNNPTQIVAADVSAVLTTTTPGITIISGNASYGSIGAGSSSTNAQSPFVFLIDRSVACGTTINFSVNVSFGGGISPVNLAFPITIGAPVTTIASFLGSPNPSGTGSIFTTGTQSGRLSANSVSSSCGSTKSAPAVSLVGSVQSDSYIFTNSATVSQCVTVTLTAPQAGMLFSAVYGSAGYDRTNPRANYLADSGNFNATQTYSFTSFSNQPFTVVVHEMTPGQSNGAPYTLKVNANSCGSAPACTPVNITNTDVASGALLFPYSQSFTATGGSGLYNFSLQGTLPPGLSFSGNSITGTPTQGGSFPITVNASDVAGCPAGSKNFTLVIVPNSISATAGTPQSTPFGHKFTTVLEATVLDPINQPINGAVVTFTIVPNAGAGATFSGGQTVVTASTNSNGKASSPILTANGIAGGYMVNATVTGALSPAVFNLSNLFYKSGDINADGKVNVQDLFTMANFLAGNTHLNATEAAAADVFDDQTGKINVQDLLTMANFLAGNTHTLPVIAGSNASPTTTVPETALIFEPRRFVMGLSRGGQILYSDD